MNIQFQCSKSCGFGIRLRNVTCPKSSTCDETKRPVDKELCSPQVCPSTPPPEPVIDFIDIPEETADTIYERKEFVENVRVINGLSTSTPVTTASTQTPKLTPTGSEGQSSGIISPLVTTEATKHGRLPLLDIKEGGSNVLVDLPSSFHESKVDEILHNKDLPDKPIHSPGDTPRPTQHKHRHGHSMNSEHQNIQSSVHVHPDKLHNMPALPDIKNLHPLPKFSSLPDIMSGPRRRMGPPSMIIPSVYEWVPKSWNPVGSSAIFYFSFITWFNFF